MIIEIKCEELERIAAALEVMAKSAQMSIDAMVNYEETKNDSLAFDRAPTKAEVIEEVEGDMIDDMPFDEPIKYKPGDPRQKPKLEDIPEGKSKSESKKSFGEVVDMTTEPEIEDDQTEVVVKKDRKKSKTIEQVIDEEDEPLEQPEEKPKKSKPKKKVEKVEDDELDADW